MMSPLSRCNQNAAKRTLTTGGRGHTPEIAQSPATTGHYETFIKLKWAP